MTLTGQTIGSEYRATNAYQRDGDEWKLVHHHADIDPEFVELVQSLGPESSRTPRRFFRARHPA